MPPVEPHAVPLSAAEACCSQTQGARAQLHVVHHALVGVREHLVGLSDALEGRVGAALGLRGCGVLVGVPPQAGFAVALLHHRAGGLPRHAQHGVVRHVPHGHGVAPPPLPLPVCGVVVQQSLEVLRRPGELKQRHVALGTLSQRVAIAFIRLQCCGTVVNGVGVAAQAVRGTGSVVVQSGQVAWRRGHSARGRHLQGAAIVHDGKVEALLIVLPVGAHGGVPEHHAGVTQNTECRVAPRLARHSLRPQTVLVHGHGVSAVQEEVLHDRAPVLRSSQHQGRVPQRVGGVQWHGVLVVQAPHELLAAPHGGAVHGCVPHAVCLAGCGGVRTQTQQVLSDGGVSAASCRAQRICQAGTQRIAAVVCQRLWAQDGLHDVGQALLRGQAQRLWRVHAFGRLGISQHQAAVAFKGCLG